MPKMVKLVGIYDFGVMRYVDSAAISVISNLAASNSTCCQIVIAIK